MHRRPVELALGLMLGHAIKYAAYVPHIVHFS